MAQIERNPLGDIRNGLVAVISKSANLPALRQNLENQGLANMSHFILTQDEAKDLELVSGGVLKVLRKALAINMVEIEEQLVKAVKSGDAVIYIKIDGDDNRLKEQAQDVLDQHQASFIHYFGPWSVATVQT